MVSTRAIDRCIRVFCVFALLMIFIYVLLIVQLSINIQNRFKSINKIDSDEMDQPKIEIHIKSGLIQSNKEISHSIPIDCETLINNFDHNLTKIQIDSIKKWTPKNHFSSKVAFELAKNCTLLDKLNENTNFNSTSPSDEETYPLAFSIVASGDIEQLLRLISTIHQPQNQICIKLDSKSPKIHQAVLQSLSDCHSNIHVPAQNGLKIHWGHYSILQAQMECLALLRNISQIQPWNYVQLISSNDLPLKTNLEMIKILQMLNGSNDVQLERTPTQRWKHPNYFVPGSDRSAIPFHLRELYQERNAFGFWISDLNRVRHPPHGLVITKGSYANSLSRDFIDFLFTDQKSIDFYRWVNETFVPDELFFSTLVHNLKSAPGYFDGSCLSEYERRRRRKSWISRYDIWNTHDCGGKILRRSCVFGVGDLPKLSKAPQLFAHKFYLDFEPAVYFCQIQKLDERTRNGIVDIDQEYYEALPAVRYERMNKKEKVDWDCA